MRAEPELKADRKTWIGLAVLALPCVLYSMDLTVLNLAVPQIVADLAPSAAQQLWMVDIYGFVVAGSLIIMGNLGDRIGRRKLLMIGAAAFGVASLAAALSSSAAMLIASRAALGVAGATLAPSTLSLIRSMFHDPRQRTVAIGIWVASYSVGAVLGPVIGGVMLVHFAWGSVFLLGIPVMLLLLAIGPLLLPEVRDEDAGPFDLASAAMAFAGLMLVIYGCKQIAQRGLAAWDAIAIAAGVGIAAAFWRRQHRLERPLIDLRLFQLPSFGAALAVYMIASFVMLGVYVAMAQELQLVLGLSPLEAGMWCLPSSGTMIVGSLVAPALARRFAPIVVISGALLLASVGLVIIAARIQLDGVVIGSMLLWFGGAHVAALASELLVGSAPEAQAGAAAGLSETSAELGGALGVALLGSLGTAIYRSGLRADTPTAADTFARATAIASGTHAPWLPTARDAFVHAFQITVAAGAVLLATSAIVLLVRHRRPRALLDAALLPS